MTESECSLRPINCELNYLSVPDGSTMFMQGDTSVVAGVYGPIEAKMTKMVYNKATIEANFSPMKGPPNINEKYMEKYLKDTCESAILTMLHPVSTIAINVQEMQDSGGLLACAMNASCLALINSGVPMRFTFAALHCMIDDESKKLIIDPTATQLKNAKATFTLAFDSINKELIACETSGIFSEKELLDAVDKCKEISQYLFDFYRDAVKKYASLL